MGLQRHIKVLGIFARLWYRDGKRGYLKDLPLVLDYVRETAQALSRQTEAVRRLHCGAHRYPRSRRRATARIRMSELAAIAAHGDDPRRGPRRAHATTDRLRRPNHLLQSRRAAAHSLSRGSVGACRHRQSGGESGVAGRNRFASTLQGWRAVTAWRSPTVRSIPRHWKPPAVFFRALALARARSLPGGQRRHLLRHPLLAAAPGAVQADSHLVLVPNPPQHTNGDFGIATGGGRYHAFGRGCRATPLPASGLYRESFFEGCRDGAFPLKPLLLRSMSAGRCYRAVAPGRVGGRRHAGPVAGLERASGGAANPEVPPARLT